MYGVPEDLGLGSLTGTTLIQVALGEFQGRFRFQPEAEIGVVGQWELRDRSGQLIDMARPPADRDAYRVHYLLGRKVTRAQVDAPESVTLEFDSGLCLQIFDSSQEFESFTIQPGGIVV